MDNDNHNDDRLFWQLLREMLSQQADSLDAIENVVKEPSASVEAVVSLGTSMPAAKCIQIIDEENMTGYMEVYDADAAESK